MTKRAGPRHWGEATRPGIRRGEGQGGRPVTDGRQAVFLVARGADAR